MNCLIVDDELPARELLEDNIRQISYLKLVAHARNAMEASTLLNVHPIDLVFLDIQMPGINGLQFLGSLKNRPLVIMVTAFKEYALQGFELDVIDYLVKPVSFERFLKAVQKANNIFELNKWKDQSVNTTTDHVFVNSNYALVKVMLEDITMIEGLKDYVKIHLTTQKSIVTRLNLKTVEGKLGTGKFMRIHKSYIVAIDKIDSVQKTQLFIGGKEIPIGEAYRQILANYIKQRNL